MDGVTYEFYWLAHIDQDLIAKYLYFAVAVVFIAVAILFYLPVIKKRYVLDKVVHRLMTGVFLVAVAESVLAVWFSVSRDLLRPDAMHESWGPVLLRLVMLVGALLHLAGYRAKTILVALTAGWVTTEILYFILLLLFGGVDELDRYLPTVLH